MSDSTYYYVNLSQFNYQGSETDSIKTTVNSGVIEANLKVDNTSTTPTVNVNVTSKGILIDLILNSTNSPLRLVKTTNGLDVKYTWDDGNNILFQCLTYDQYSLLGSKAIAGKVYFITDEQMIILNGKQYGKSLKISSTDTIKATYSWKDITLDTIIDSTTTNLLTKSSNGLLAQLIWEEH